jgi:hypothetical protein
MAKESLIDHLAIAHMWGPVTSQVEIAELLSFAEEDTGTNSLYEWHYYLHNIGAGRWATTEHTHEGLER